MKHLITSQRKWREPLSVFFLSVKVSLLLTYGYLIFAKTAASSCDVWELFLDASVARGFAFMM